MNGDRWCCVAYVRDGDSWAAFEEALARGEREALAHLAGWDCGADSEHDVLDGAPEPMRSGEHEADGYYMTWDGLLGCAALYRHVGYPRVSAAKVAEWAEGRGHAAGCPSCGSQAYRRDSEELAAADWTRVDRVVEWSCGECGLRWRERRVHPYLRSEVTVLEGE